MSTKLTDESVAKALGWTEGKRLSGKPGMVPPSRGGDWKYCREAPPFTTSLDAIVAEVEARGRAWRVDGSKPNSAGYRQYVAWVVGDVDGKYRRAEGMDATPAAALSRALLAYLKEAHRG